jgi:DNA-binding MarR family transcriptional regulator
VKRLSLPEYRHISEFRYQIRQFLHFSEQAARENGIDPQQHQLLLAIKGLPESARPTIGTVAERLCIRHHSAVELVNRGVAQGSVVKQQGSADAREVLLSLTPQGEQILQKLSVLHWQELQKSGPALSTALRGIVQHTGGSKTRKSA